MESVKSLSAANGSKSEMFLSRMSAVWLAGKVILALLGMLAILKAALLMGRAYEAIPPILFNGLYKAAMYFAPVLWDLVRLSIPYLLVPIGGYLLIGLGTTSRVWRIFWYIVGLSWFFLVFVSVFEHFPWPTLEGFSWSALKDFGQSLKDFNWKEFRALPLALVQGYLFALWVLPREFWNILGLLVSGLLGLMILIFPDLPTAFDDFGIFGAILTFFMGYLNALAILLQRVVGLMDGYRQKR